MKYEWLDKLILKRISEAGDAGLELTYILSSEMFLKSYASVTDVVSRLQALRKRGLIRFDSKLGWLAT